MKKKLALATFIFFSSLALPVTADNWTYDFENASKDIGMRTNHLEMNLNGLAWKSYGVCCNKNNKDWHNGKGSARICGRNGTMAEMPYFEMTEAKPGGIGTVTFSYHIYNNWNSQKKQTDWIVQVTQSENGGWKKIGSAFKPTSEVQTFTATANLKSARIRIVRADYQTFDYAGNTESFSECFNIDDMNITDSQDVLSDLPDITLAKDVINFGQVYKGDSKTDTLRFTFKNLTAPISFTINDETSSFSIPVTEQTHEEKSGESLVEITYAPLSYGNHTAIMTVSSGETQSTVGLQGNCIRKPGEFKYSGGTGTQEDPFLITRPDDIEDLSIAVDQRNDYKDKFFKMTNNIDMTKIKGMKPIGNNFGADGADIKYFAGTFDGCGFTISNLKMEFTGGAQIAVALFGVIQNAIIKNVNINNSSFSADALTAGLVATAMGGDVENCHIGSNVTISSPKQYYASGLVCGAFANAVRIKDCTSAATVKSKSVAGGILAANNVAGTSINRCVNYGSITATGDYAGGIVGFIDDGNIIINDCANMGSISAQSGNTGGTGGLLGLAAPSVLGPVVISNSYNAGMINVSGKHVSPITLIDTGGGTQFNVTNSFYNSDLFTDTDASGTPIATADMKQADFAYKLNANRLDGPWRWAENTNDGYPMPSNIGEIPKSDKMVLVADSITIPQYAYYHVFIKEYTPQMLEYMADKEHRIAVKYEVQPDGILESYGNQNSSNWRNQRQSASVESKRRHS